MPSPHTFIIHGVSRILVFIVPEIDLSITRTEPIPVTLIWSWSDESSDIEYGSMEPIWDASSKKAPIVYLVARWLAHVLTLEPLGESNLDCTRFTVAHHKIIPISDTVSRFCLGAIRRISRGKHKSRKGVWFSGDALYGSTFDIFTINMRDPTIIGKVQFQMNQCDLMDHARCLDIDFDEVSGRVLLMTSNPASCCRLYIGEVLEVI